MYCLQINIQPTAAMTFRILPGSILNIATYPFVPPTTLSGFLRRLGMIYAGFGIPETRVNNDNPPFYALPQRYCALGAYPVKGKLSAVHRTYRKGMREFNHDAFSRIYQDGNQALQLHTWEYLIAEELVGYVITDSPQGLEHFQELVGYGCKLGKEGFAIISQVSEIIELHQETLSKYPSTTVPIENLLQSNQFVSGCDIYNLYRYKWSTDNNPSSVTEGFLDNQETKVAGFIPFATAYFPDDTGNPPTLEYFTNKNEINIPVSLVKLFKGEVYV
ncbi:hypothetical protein [Anabaena sp. CCY 0017]|uniref:hypothetical protein n=1 Tax=Anabaena sp. CCY 0017 TaxID=3103866 RepID=UPI0039C6EBAE